MNTFKTVKGNRGAPITNLQRSSIENGAKHKLLKGSIHANVSKGVVLNKELLMCAK